MKKLFELLIVTEMVAFVACGPSQKGNDAKEKEKQDSINTSEKEKKEADAFAALEVRKQNSNNDTNHKKDLIDPFKDIMTSRNKTNNKYGTHDIQLWECMQNIKVTYDNDFNACCEFDFINEFSKTITSIKIGSNPLGHMDEYTESISSSHNEFQNSIVQILPNETKHFKSGKILTGNYKNNEIKNSIVWIESVRFSDGTIK